MGRENKLFLRLCGVQRDAGAPCICARDVCGCIRFAGGSGIRPYGGGRRLAVAETGTAA